MGNNKLVAALADAIMGREPLPDVPAELSIEQAYQMQSDLVGQLPRGIAGLKAGLTNTRMQSHFGLEDAVLARLYDDGRLTSGVTIQSGPGISLECEIAILIDANGKPISIAPAIEVVYLELANPKKMSAAVLIGGNLGADRFILGEPTPWAEHHKAQSVVLKCDGETKIEAELSESLGGPEPALAWMLAEAERRSLALESVGGNIILMAGTCGGAIKAEPGKYVADYGALGTVVFTVS